jgi:hypothetical protein
MALSDVDNFARAAARQHDQLEGDTMLQEDLSIATFASALPPRELCIGDQGSSPNLDHPMDVQVFHIRMANSAGMREKASLLIRKMYGWRGYSVEPHELVEANKVTLYAETGGVVVGTMSLCFDSDTRLPADDNFGDLLDTLRRQGRRLCEPSRLAIDKGVTKRVFGALVHISYIYSHNIHGYRDYIIEVNPRHVMFYKRMLGFSDFGGERHCTRVGAPAVLLRLPLSEMGLKIKRWGGINEFHGDEHSMYPYFFPADDEPGITERLRTGRN